MGTYTHKSWMCPFYTGDDKEKILCENGSRITFKDRQLLMEYADQYCCTYNYNECSIAQYLNKLYGEQK